MTRSSCPECSSNCIGRLRNVPATMRRAIRVYSMCSEILSAANVVIGSSVHPFAAFAASRLARQFDVPFLFEIRDLWPETLVTVGSMKRWSPLTGAMYTFEKDLLSRAMRINTLLPKAGESAADQVEGICQEFARTTVS